MSPIKKETWETVNQNVRNGQRHNPSEGLTTTTIRQVLLEYKTPVAALPDGYADVYTNATADAHYLYLSTQGQYDSTKQPVAIGGEILSIRRDTGEIHWRRFVSDYSLVPLDFARSAPAVWKSYLYFCTGISAPQSITPYESTLKNLFTGTPVQPTGTRQSVICVEKQTGHLVWRTFVGNVANHIQDPDNWVYITQSPVIFERNDGVPVLAVGTSSGQSFQPWFYTNFAPYTGLSLGNQFDFQMTDIGTLHLIHAKTGKRLKKISAGPPPLRAGTPVPQEAMRCGESTTVIRYIVQPEDLETGGVLNPILPPFAGTGPLLYVLETGGTVPSPLEGVRVVNTSNQSVILEAGQTVDTTLNNVVVSIDATFVGRTTTFLVGDTPYTTSDPLVGLSGGTGLRPVRINKILRVGDVMTSRDAYALSCFGASIWGNSIVVYKNRLYFTTGQPHFNPYGDTLSVNRDVLPFLTTQRIIQKTQETYQAEPTEERYAAILMAYKNYEQTIQERFTRPVSPRYASFLFSSVVAIDVRVGSSFGKIVAVHRSCAYDFWHYGFTSLFSRCVSNPGGWSDSQLYFQGEVGPDGDFGQGVYLVRQKDKKDDLLVAATKSGFLYVLDTDLRNLYHRQIGNSVVNGCSNYGSTVSGSLFYTINTQAYYTTDENLPPPSTIYNFAPKLQWYVSPQQSYSPQQSSVLAFDVNRRVIVWQQPVVPSNTVSPYICTLSQISSTDHLVFVPGADGVLYVRDARTGQIVQTFALDGAGGQSSPALLDNHVYAAIGRSSLSSLFNSNGALYGPSKYLYSYSLSA